MKWHHWAYLNDEGKKLYGEIFPDGIVPVKVMLSQNATLENQEGIQRVYKVDWLQLTEKQKEQITQLLSTKFNAPKDDIRKQFDLDGFIPLRAEYVSGAGTDQTMLFI